MAKKSVIANRFGNPALQFLTPQEEAAEPIAPVNETVEEPVAPVTPPAPVAPAVQPQNDEGLDSMFTGIDVPDGYRLVSKETRSRRLQLLLTPTLYNRVKATADAHGMKVNDYIHRVLDLATKDENL